MPIEWTAKAALFPLNFVAWSIFVEVGLSLVFGAGFTMLLDLRRLAALMFGFAILLACSALQFAHLNLGSSLVELPGGAVRGLFSFLAGLLLARLGGFERRSLKVSFPTLAMLLLVLLAVDVSGAVRTVKDILTVTILSPLIVLLGARCQIAGEVRRFALALGRASYPAYLLQAPLAAYLAKLLNLAGVRPSLWPGLGFVALLFWMALLTDKYVDKPLRAWLAAAVHELLARRGKDVAVRST